MTAQFDAIPNHRAVLGPAISSLGKVADYISPEYNSPTLNTIVEPTQYFITARNNSSAIIYHFWSFRDRFSIHIVGSDEFFRAEIINDIAKEAQRWIEAIASEEF